jgi:transposase
LQALHRVRSRLVGQRTGINNQFRAFLLERGIAVRQGLRFLRTELPKILATRCDVLSPWMVHMVHVISDLAGDWHRLDEGIEGVSTEIEALADQDPACERLMTVPGIGHFQFVPYRGTAPAIQDVVAGQIDMAISDPVVSMPQARAGTIKAYWGHRKDPAALRA